jgi:hypothetical protein
MQDSLYFQLLISQYGFLKCVGHVTNNELSSFPETRRALRYYDDWPTKGVRFIDIAPALGTPAALKAIIDSFQSRYSSIKIELCQRVWH